MNQATAEWMLTNPGTPVSIYDIAGLVGKAFPLSFTPKNIISGFACTGIWPLNVQIFDDEDFISAELTNRPYEQPAKVQTTPSKASSSNAPVTPEDLRPFPKAPPKQVSKKGGRKPGKCRIPTDTPEKNEIAQEKKKPPPPEACRILPDTDGNNEITPEKKQPPRPAKKTARQKVAHETSSDDDEEEIPELAESSGGSDFIGESSGSSDENDNFFLAMTS